MSETSRKRFSLGRIALAVVGGAAVVGLVRYGLFDYSHTHETSLIVEDGQVTQTVKGGGWYYRLPGDSREVVRIARNVQKLEVAGINASSNDNYALKDSEISVRYRIPSRAAAEVYRQIPDHAAIIRDAVVNAYQNSINAYDLIEIPDNRKKIGRDIERVLKAEFASRYGIEIRNADLQRWGWSKSAKATLDELKKAATARKKAKAQRKVNQTRQARKTDTAKAEAKRQAIKAEAERKDKLKNAKAEAERRTIRAKAKRKQVIKDAKAEAQATRVRAKAEAARIRSIADALETGNGVIRHVLATSWDGHLPDVTSGKTEIVRQLVTGEAGAAREAGPLASKANRGGNGGGAAGE